MKNIYVITIGLLAAGITTTYADDTFVCVLADQPLSKSPVAKVEARGADRSFQLTVFKNIQAYDTVFNTTVTDNTDDALALYTNKEKKVSLRFYLDETDMLGLMDGTIKSPVMRGSVKCTRKDS